MNKTQLSTIILSASALALGAFLLQWLEYQYFLKAHPVESYLILFALGFGALGLWTGYRLTQKKPAGSFERNDAAISSLGITAREYEVLELLAAGQSNKEIARTLNRSPNTVKTHVARLFEKLDVEKRMQAVQEARSLHLIP